MYNRILLIWFILDFTANVEEQRKGLSSNAYEVFSSH